MTTKEPVTLSGWYELTDGRVQRYAWHQGRLVGHEIVDSWADVPQEGDRLAALAAEEEAEMARRART